MHDTTETLHYTRVHTTRAQVWLCEQACNVIMILLKYVLMLLMILLNYL